MITAIIPCYNTEAYLAETIESVLQQTRPVDEIVVVDDCSTDRSREVARRYPVTLLQTPTNRGPSAPRNIGIRAASGDVIAWLDSDDYWEPNHVETVVGLLDQHPDAAVAFSAVRLFGKREGVWGRGHCEGKPTEAFWPCFRGTIVPTTSVATRKDALLAVGGSDENIRVAPDFDLWLRLSRICKFVSTSMVTANYRWHGSQISAQPLKQYESMYAARFRCWQRLQDEGEEDVAKKASQEMRSIWDKDLSTAWGREDRGAISFLLHLGRYIPGHSTELSRKLSKRLWLPMWPSAFWNVGAKVARSSVGRLKS